MQEQGLAPRTCDLQQELIALGQIPTLWYTGIQNGYNCFKTQSYDDYVMQQQLHTERSMDRLEESLRKYDNLNIFFKLIYLLFNRKYEHFKSILYYQKYSSAKTNRELRAITDKYNPFNLSYFSSIKKHLIALREDALLLDDSDANDLMPDCPASKMLQMALKDQIIAMRIEFEELFKQQRDNDPEEAEAAIKAYYKKNSKKYHPDKNPEALEAAKEGFIALTEDYQFYCRLITVNLYSYYENKEQMQDLMHKHGLSEENDRLQQQLARENEERRAEFMHRIQEQDERLQQERTKYRREQEERFRQVQEKNQQEQQRLVLELKNLELRRAQYLQEAECKRLELEQKMKGDLQESERKRLESEQKMKGDLQESERKRLESEQKMQRELQESERKRLESEQKMRAEFLELVRSLASGNHTAPQVAPVIAPTLLPLANMAAASPAATSTAHTPPTLAPTSGDKQPTAFFAHK